MLNWMKENDGKLALIFTVGFMLAALYVISVREANCKPVTKTVVEVGGCDRFACAVKYDDGTRSSRDKPMVGDTVTQCDFRWQR